MTDQGHSNENHNLKQRHRFRYQEPWRHFAELQDLVSDLFDEKNVWGSGGDFNYLVDCDFSETIQEYIVLVDIPGVARDDVLVEFEDNKLIISGNRNERLKIKGEKFHFKEIPFGTFKRVIPFPKKVNPNSYSAVCKDGVLEVNVTKEKVAKGNVPIH